MDELPSVPVKCSICSEPYREPKVLSCFHCFCRDCIELLRVQKRGFNFKFHCPECRRDATIPDDDVSKLPDAFPVYHTQDLLRLRQRLNSTQHGIQCDSCLNAEAGAFCHDCGQYICNGCSGRHEAELQYSDHHVVSFVELSSSPNDSPRHAVLTRSRTMGANKTFLLCKKHFGRRVCYYCNCGELICEACAGEEHKEHKHKYISEAVQDCQKEIRDQLPNIRVVHKRIAGAAAQVPNIRSEVAYQGQALSDSVDSSFARLHQLLDRHKADMKTRISQMTKTKLSKLGNQQLELEGISAEMQRLEDFTENCLETSTERELLLLYKFLQERVTQALQQYSRKNVKPVEMPNLAIKVSCSPHLQDACRKHAVVYSDTADASKCIAEGPGLKAAETMKFSEFTVMVFDKEGKPCRSTQNVSVQVKCLSNEDKFQAEVSDIGQGMYRVSYCPKFRGDHEIIVHVNEKVIPGSPLNLVVWQPPSQLGRCHGVIDGVTSPRGLALKKNGNLLVCEWNGGKVVELDDLGRIIRSFGSNQLSHPASVAVDRQGAIYVVDAAGERSCVNKYNSSGDLLTSVGREGTELSEFKNPRGLAVSNRNELFVCDRDNHRIQVFNSELKYLRCINLKNIDRQLAKPSQPNGIAFDQSGNMFVTDYSNSCILFFNMTEQFVMSFSSEGGSQGCLAGPESVHIDKGLLYVTESTNHRVSVFRTTAEFVMTFGRIGRGDSELKFPMGIVTNRFGMVYVCELLNNRIQVF